ncbi:LacI family transcriptional regulator [Mycetocola tolaasinivorans]|uniref:LacI family transcriptional regulator n=1 Tax=Mycetocola tolaasinivorans TaxID=76635 RepID=A0A3L7AA91_9MICO|nr:LacI family DNA-binding transcriptional regulator [Mycetocola tolaasinivorans]RLP77299.1 LacI family transcriptional regulator [Mycetocola tolaasinivorans]
MVGIDEVAERARVSTATVSRALSGRGYVAEGTRARVHEAARELGYVVSSSASGLASGRTRNVGVVVPFLSHWFFAAVVEGAQSALQEQGYDLTLYNLSGGDDARARVFDDLLLRQRVDAVLAIGLELTPEEAGRLVSLRKPVVGLGGPLPGVTALAIDDRASVRLATEHLIALGHTRIAYIGGSADFDLDFHLPTMRQLGYRDALIDAGIEIEPALERGADFTLRGGNDAAKQILGVPRDRPTAIVAASDVMAIGAILAARELGLTVPADLSVVGLDGVPDGEFFGLTTVAQYPAEQGRTAAKLLIERLNAPLADTATADPVEAPPAVEMLLPTTLIVRDSTARPRA